MLQHSRMRQPLWARLRATQPQSYYSFVQYEKHSNFPTYVNGCQDDICL